MCSGNQPGTRRDPFQGTPVTRSRAAGGLMAWLRVSPPETVSRVSPPSVPPPSSPAPFVEKPLRFPDYEKERKIVFGN